MLQPRKPRKIVFALYDFLPVQDDDLALKMVLIDVRFLFPKVNSADDTDGVVVVVVVVVAAAAAATDLYKYSVQMPYLLFTSYHIM